MLPFWVQIVIIIISLVKFLFLYIAKLLHIANIVRWNKDFHNSKKL